MGARAPSPPDPDVPENDPAPHFVPLFQILETVVQTRDYATAAIGATAATGAVAARAAGVTPEAVIAFLRRRLHEAPLSAVGDWYRGVLIERVVAHAIAAYFDEVLDSPRSGLSNG